MAQDSDSDTVSDKIPSGPKCPVVEIRSSPDAGWFEDSLVAVCPDIPVGAVSDFTNLLNAPKPKLETIARTIISRHRLPGLAAVSQITRPGYRKIVIPPPLRSPFASFELDEHNPSLLAICGQAVGPSVRPRLISGRFLLILGWAAILIVSLFSIVLWRNSWYGVGALALAIYTARWLHLAAPNWQVTPNGIVVKGDLYTPRNTILVIKAVVGWDATLYRDGTSHTKLLTYLECIALLAVWQNAMAADERPASEGHTNS
jgi:hypothetical protein